MRTLARQEHGPDRTVLAGLWLILFGLLLLGPWRSTVAGMVAIWSRSDTFMHGFFVLPVALYLLYEKTHRRPLPALAPSFVGLWVVVASIMLWSLGRAAAVTVVEQAALVVGVIGLSHTLFGGAFVRYAAYPLGFLLLAVPFGEGLVPQLIALTTEFVVAGLRLLAIPVYREENLLTLPSGSWSVVSACSGIRYLLALVSVAMVYAFLNIQNGWRRLLFLGFAVLLALVGNWLRALGIVLLGHFSGNQLAVGADHLIYGWVFFAVLVLGLILFGEWLFAQDVGRGVDLHRDKGRGPEHRTDEGADTATPRDVWRTSGAVLAILLLSGWQLRIAPGLVPTAATLHAFPVTPPSLPAEWIVTAPGTWRPDFAAAQAPAHFGYQHVTAGTDTGMSGEIDLLVYTFNDQGPGFEAMGATNVVVAESNPFWTQIGASGRFRRFAGDAGQGYRSFGIRSAEGAMRHVAVLPFSRRGYTPSTLEMKIAEVVDRLRGRPAWAFVAVVSTPASESTQREDWMRLDHFVASLVILAEQGEWPRGAAPAASSQTVSASNSDDI